MNATPAAYVRKIPRRLTKAERDHIRANPRARMVAEWAAFYGVTFDQVRYAYSAKSQNRPRSRAV